MENLENLNIHSGVRWRDTWQVDSDTVISNSFWKEPSKFTDWIKGKESTNRNFAETNNLWSEKNLARVDSKNITTLQSRVQELGLTLNSIYEQIGCWIKKQCTLDSQIQSFNFTKKAYLDQAKGTLLAAIFSLNSEIQELPNFILCGCTENKEKEIELFSTSLTSISQKDALINCEYFLKYEERYLKLSETLKKEIFKVQLCLFALASHLGKDIEFQDDNDKKAFYQEHRTTVFSSLFSYQLPSQNPLYETLDRLEGLANMFFSQQKEKM